MLATVRSSASGIARAAEAEAEVTVDRGTARLTRFANSFIHQNVAEDVEPRRAPGGARRPDGDRQARRPARRRSPGAARRRRARGRPASGRPTRTGRGSPPAAAAPGRRPLGRGDGRGRRQTSGAGLVADFVDAAGGLETAGCVLDERLGRRVCQQRRAAAVRSRRRRASRTASPGRRRPTAGRPRERPCPRDLDGRAGRRAGRRARPAGRQTRRDLEPGRYEVILEPQCVANMLPVPLRLRLQRPGGRGGPILRPRSARRSSTQRSRSATTRRTRGRSGCRFDVEGTPKRRLDLVARRRHVGACSTTRRTAARRPAPRAPATPSRAATRWGAARRSNLGRSAAGDRTTDELIGGVGRGLLVTDFWYTRILDPRTQVVTGLTRNGVWLIEDGRVVRPVSNLRFTQSYPRGAGPGRDVAAISRQRALIPSGFDDIPPRAEPAPGVLELHGRGEGLTRRQPCWRPGILHG